jgi:hypothetical protein
MYASSQRTLIFVDVEHKVILHLYNNSMPFTVSSFDIVVEQSVPNDNNLTSDLFGNLFHCHLTYHKPRSCGSET